MSLASSDIAILYTLSH